MELMDFMSEYELKTSGLHSISPYIGKIRPLLGRYLVKRFAVPHGTVWDPFCGSGTIPLEGWLHNQTVYATDLNLYACVLTKAKLFPPPDLESALKKLEYYHKIVNDKKNENRITEEAPDWVKQFFHPQTLLEIHLWCHELINNDEWFILSCILGILHHQRPGFLSYPSSHGAPYLRNVKFKPAEFPDLYEYRDVYSRLQKKILRVMKNYPDLNYSIRRTVINQSSETIIDKRIRVNTIITSPPYMRALTYARDNRLRLWFLGVGEWDKLDVFISPKKEKFIKLMQESFGNWSNHQEAGDYCVLIVGDIQLSSSKSKKIPDLMQEIATDNGYCLEEILYDPIPDKKRVVKGKLGVQREAICIFKKME